MSKDQYKVVIIGFGHVHINDVAAHFAENERINLCACADIEPLVEELKTAPYTRKWNIDYCSKKFDLKVYENWKEMLDVEEADLCIINSENAYHAEITAECARRGVGVCVEKPMATSLSDGLKMYRASKTYDTLLMVNWPITWNPGMHMVKKLIDDGVIGDIIQIKTRMGHTGPLGPGAKHRGINETAAPMTDVEKTRTWWHQHTSGGGAMSDYCCYGGVLSYWYAGKPAVAAMGMRINSITTMGDAEDNAAMFVRYPDCYAVLEATWTTYDHTFKSPIVYGTKGAIVGDYKTGKVQFHGADGCVNDIPNDPLPEELKDVSTAYVHHMDTGKPLHLTSQIEFNLNALAILDAGIRSANSNKMEIVNNINWQIG